MSGRRLWVALLFDHHSELRRIIAQPLEHHFLFFHSHRWRNLQQEDREHFQTPAHHQFSLTGSGPEGLR